MCLTHFFVSESTVRSGEGENIAFVTLVVSDNMEVRGVFVPLQDNIILPFLLVFILHAKDVE
jgi:hypothetical protein